MYLSEFKRVIHFGPLITIVMVEVVSFTCVHCLQMWWPFSQSWSGLVNLMTIIFYNAVLFYNLLTSLFIGPGYVPQHWKPDNPEDESSLQYCKICKSFKAPRAHHCRRCKRCVLKMDHHCPWINNCVGHRNHTNFIWFLVFMIVSCTHATIILGYSIYRAIYKSHHFFSRAGHHTHLTVNGFLVTIFALGSSIGAIIGLSALLFIQMRLIVKNQTGIESYIVSKACRPRPANDVFVYPYDFGWKENVRQFFFGPRSGYPDDGIEWRVKEGCNKYALTIEQIQQKEEKKRSMREYLIVQQYGGWIFPITKGIRVVCTTPCCTDDRRISVEVGDRVRVSRWKTHWLYGEIQTTNNEDDKPTRGWFPRICVCEWVARDGDESTKKND